MAGPPKKRVSRDVALLCGPTDDGQGARILRSRNGALEAGEVRPVKEGRPLSGGEVVKLVPWAEAPCVCDVEVLHESRPHERNAEPSASQKGSHPQKAPTDGDTIGRPAQVATEGYRLNWDRVFGAGKRRKGDTSLN